MVTLAQIQVDARSPERLDKVVGPERAARFAAVAHETRELLAGRAVINVSSTARGGGVAELLQTLLAYARGVGVDTRWFVIEGTPEFFDITKRIHNNLYGTGGDGGPLGPAEHRVYDEVLHANAVELRAFVRSGDVVLLHDPQTAGLVAPAQQAGGIVVWRCHVGVDIPNEHVRRAWDWLRPYVEAADAFVFSRRAFAPEWVADDTLSVIAPSIDPFSAKNCDMSPDEALRVLRHVGLLAGADRPPPAPFIARDRAGEEFLPDRHLEQWASLIARAVTG